MIKLKQILEFTNERGIDVRPINSPEEAKRFDDFLKDHYLGTNPTGIIERYIVKYNNEAIGLIAYGVPTSPMLSKQLNLQSGELLELRRLFILDDVKLHNAESQVITLGNKELKENRPNVKVVVTYADPQQGHSGVIYQATNAIYGGRGTGKTGKHKYYYILGNKSEKKRTMLQTGIQSQEYPKESLEIETIKKVGNKWAVYPKKGGKRLGTHDSKKSAQKQLSAIEINK